MSGRTEKHGAQGELADLSALVTPVSLYGGRYELEELLGVGASGSVYRARDVELNEVVALKVLRKELVGNPQTLEHFRNEVRLARRVTHPNVARMFDISRRDRKKPALLPTCAAWQLRRTVDGQHVRRVHTGRHGITTGSRGALRGGRTWAK